jgi:hypothetical protein
VVSSAQEAVTAGDDADTHARGPVLAHLLDVAGELAGLRVVLPAQHVAQLGFLRGLVDGRPLGEQAHRERVALPVLPHRAADDVVGEHAVDVQVGLLGQLGVVVGAEEPLLLAGHRHEDDRGVEVSCGHHARELEHGGHSRRVIVGAGRVTRGVERVAAARVVVTAHHVITIGGLGLGPVQSRDDVGDRRRLRDALVVGCGMRSAGPWR